MKTKTALAHLPNARHIDRILSHLKDNPEKWDAAWDAAWDADEDAARDAAWNAAWDAARVAAGDAAGDAALDAVRNAARNAARDAAWEAARNAAWEAARFAAVDAMTALIAYDDCSNYLEYTPEQLEVWAILSEDPAAILLLPAVRAMNSKETV